ncbi:ESCRT II complex subunit Dot2 [Metarhizium acridum]|uniref:Vacuolar-sorting protein SNF8 n=1 Tax=Metarhizium acridum (strain CQMa 102) TaxID=655827 RepID=E9DVL6_METAQ|nr:ELL complex subunit Eap30, putative [Metarhizium acridum CQMa 102]EFY92393.1 ELL complex subunit Eap30, putative [Metarhizium acridum CQMa 102]KAG8424208.1 ESCRT II complex subunit Dot2 [Metarhizium acridum]
MSRKGVGIGAFDRSRLTSAHYASHGSSLRANNAQALETQLAVFRSLLQQFAQTHAKDIRSDPSFRAQFARMCTAIGVDPLSSSNSSGGGPGGSIWAQLLGKTVNDFYFELAVRIVEMCSATRGENGGLIGLREVRERLSRGRVDSSGNSSEISEDDVRRAVETLKPLGGSYGIVRVGRKEYIRSVPRELSNDQVAAVEAAQVLGYVSVSMLCDNLGWERARCRTVIDDLVAEGMLWVDKQTGGEWEYWSPTFMVDIDEGHATVAD